MPQNGFRPESAPPSIEIKALNASVLVHCVCKRPVLLAFVTGFPLSTTCGCKRKLTIGGINVDNRTGEVQVAVAVVEPPIIEPTLGEVAQFRKQ